MTFSDKQMRSAQILGYGIAVGLLGGKHAMHGGGAGGAKVDNFRRAALLHALEMLHYLY